MFKEFSVRDILPPINIKKYAKKPETDGNIPFVSCQTTNNGIATYCGEIPEVNHCITVSTNGNCFDCFWHNYPIIPSSDVEVLHKDGITDDEKISLYICGCLAPNTNLYSYSNKPKNGKVFDTKLTLPVIENPNPDHEYTVDDIDWQYMRDRITELERDRITELNAYLQATGLNDYELTEEDKKTLSLSAKRASDEARTLEDYSEDEVIFGKFKATDLFDIKKGKRLTKADMIEGNINFVGSSSSNNGITARIGNKEYLHPAHTFTVSYNGSVGEVFLQDEPFWASDDVNVWYPKFSYNQRVVEYIISVVRQLKDKYSYTAKWTLDKMRAEVLELPVKPDGTPDFDYMERYIRAMEKVVIADVIKWKDKEISVLKQITA